MGRISVLAASAALGGRCSSVYLKKSREKTCGLLQIDIVSIFCRTYFRYTEGFDNNNELEVPASELR